MSAWRAQQVARKWGHTSQFQAGEAEETVAVRPQCGPHLNTAKQFSELHTITLVNAKLKSKQLRRTTSASISHTVQHMQCASCNTHTMLYQEPVTSYRGQNLPQRPWHVACRSSPTTCEPHTQQEEVSQTCRMPGQRAQAPAAPCPAAGPWAPASAASAPPPETLSQTGRA